MPWFAALWASERGWRVFLTMLAVALLCGTIWAVFATIRHYMTEQRTTAVQIDRAEVAAEVRNQQLDAEMLAAHHKHADDLAAERARVEQMEAINASEHQPGGDPVASVYDRMRR